VSEGVEPHPLSAPAPALRFVARFAKAPRAKATKTPPVAESPAAPSGNGAKPAKARKAKAPSLGTTLVRTWHGRQLQVRVLERGYEYDGAVYKSLSAIAKAITGAHWNGRLFWGLVSRRKGR